MTKRNSAVEPEHLLSIGELARSVSISTRTIRFYEELGILPPPERTSGGTRRYPTDYVCLLEGIKTLKDLGFELEEISELSYRLTRHAGIPSVQAVLMDKIAQLRRHEDLLKTLSDAIDKSRPPADDEPVLGIVGREAR